MTETIKYILQFLLGDQASQEIINSVGYTKNEDEFSNYKLVIYPSDFFEKEIYGTAQSIPALPLLIWEECPILFGTDRVELIANTVVLHADLVASTYFLISRYEEMVRSNIRDAHKRFPGRESTIYKAGIIDKPIIEEWGVALRNLMRLNQIEIAEPEQKIQKVYLTHDVDRLAHYRNLRGMLGGLFRGLKRPSEGNQALRSFFGSISYDPWYTFPYIYRLDKNLANKIGVENCEIVTFFRTGISTMKQDKPRVNIYHPDYKNLLKLSKKKGIRIGLHSSYDAGCRPDLIQDEKRKLEKISRQSCIYNRNHYLNNREPKDFKYLIEFGFSDDFSMGYADIAGFRLGTCRSVLWINPENKELSQLRLHPLTIMDISLSDKRYMYMNAHDAYQYCEHLINTVERYNGELSLLWHNDNCEKTANSYHRKLYRDLLLLLQSKFKEYQ